MADNNLMEDARIERARLIHSIEQAIKTFEQNTGLAVTDITYEASQIPRLTAKTPLQYDLYVRTELK